MNKFHQKVELVANVLIILVAVAVVVVLVQKYLFPSSMPVNQQARLQPVVGSKMRAPDVDWSKQSKTLILALQSRCHFCNESVPFYKRIVEMVGNKNIKLVAVFPSSIQESTLHLKNLGLTSVEVKESSLGSLQVGGTPTLILVNDKGEITDYWVGKLTHDKETEVMNKLNL